MTFLTDKRKRKVFIIITSIILVLAIIVGACAVYVNDYDEADMDAIEVFAEQSHVEYRLLENDNIVFEPEGATKGFIFYPGGKVEYTAFLPFPASSRFI